MNLRGDRFQIEIPSDDDQSFRPPDSGRNAASSEALVIVKDICERRTESISIPSAPALSGQDGFPMHRKRNGASRFKISKGLDSNSVQKSAESAANPRQTARGSRTSASDSHQWIEVDQENRARLQNMSEADIDKERQDLFENLSPTLIERLLKRSNIDANPEEDFPVKEEIAKLPRQTICKTSKRVTFDTPGVGNDSEAPARHIETLHEEKPPSPSILEHASTHVHFPKPPPAPALDPNSPNFLENLHDKYFPDLPSDPSKLAWMSADSQPATSINRETAESNSYLPSASSLPPSSLRFNFKGAFLPPTMSNRIPVTAGLHHHGDAPEAAGYTIPELAHLGRSSFPAQRCIAFQTMGRLLYRLGIGEFGNRGNYQATLGGPIETEDDAEESSDDGDLARGLWRCIEQGRVLDTLNEEANRIGGHASSKAYATDALWLWRKGGGRGIGNLDSEKAPIQLD